ncbi:c-type cytochrome biogenesis protein CcmI [Afifella sp. IM 167]|uniref:c-type cytochrome biogenesis protein CcmI n=1 Tax=Afifella sp. IM 167 TaxID=2033586 RepID=UPI001CC9F51D|nr:c-type cytochrome biogenesis protein CcmI [Afifella sp. IM 167]MBZ8133924.1 c-type cytochrome biogenesis protein CcmI [Afifella sp. IM 167]
MLLWLAIALFTAVAILAVLLPLSAGAKDVASGAEEDAAVYRRQLSELERDRKWGRIGETEAEAARAEIARRLLAIDREKTVEPDRKGDLWRRRATAVLALAGIPVFAVLLYMLQGSPGMPDQPLMARLGGQPDTKNISMLVARVEDHLARNPNDGKGWEVLAPVYMRLGREADAARAYESVIRIMGSNTARQTALGEALVMAAGGVVTDRAREAFQSAARDAGEGDEGAPKARFYLALAAEQEGDTAGATKQLRDLLEGAPADASWRPAIQETLARMEKAESDTASALFQPAEPQLGPVARNSPETPPANAPFAGGGAPLAGGGAPFAGGPSQDQMNAAAEMAPEDRMAMIEGMVENLASRLQDKPDDAEGWLKLVRSYAVLGRKQDAADAARTALTSVSDKEGRRQIAQLAADLRLPGLEEVPQ